MKNNIPKDPFENLVLDKYEQEIEDALEKGEFIPVPNEKKEMERYKSYFKSMNKKNKRISIRIAEQDLLEIQKKAIKTGVPYQTLVVAILHQYAKNKINLGL